jgi:peptide/nickel transport system ATP-binding protein
VRGALLERKPRHVHAVDGVSFDVAKGETLGIVGESGCGKSTTARLLARLLPADAGELVFDGDGVGAFGGLALKAFRRNLQMVFQDSFASLNPRLTIADTIAYGPRVHGVPAARPGARAGAAGARGHGAAISSSSAIRTSCRAGSGSASTSPARWPSIRAW